MANTFKGALTKDQYDDICKKAAYDATIEVFGSLEGAKAWADKPPLKYFKVEDADDEQRRRLILCGIIPEKPQSKSMIAIVEPQTQQAQYNSDNVATAYHHGEDPEESKRQYYEEQRRRNDSATEGDEA